MVPEFLDERRGGYQIAGLGVYVNESDRTDCALLRMGQHHRHTPV